MKKAIRTVGVYFLICILFLGGITFAGEKASARIYSGEQDHTYTFTGKLKKVKFKTGNGSKAVGYALYLKKKIKVKSDFMGGISKEKRLQINATSASERNKIRRKVGKTIKVKGKIIAGMTGYYFTNYAIFGAKLVTK